MDRDSGTMSPRTEKPNPMIPHGLLFHHFHDDRHPRGQGAISAETFSDVIAFVGPERILPAGEWLRLAEAGALGPEDICLTFDDNLRCQYDIAYPVLRDLGLTAFFFVYSSPLEGKAEKLEVYRYFRTTRFEEIEDFYDGFYRTFSTTPLGKRVKAELQDVDPSAYLPAKPFYSTADRKFRLVRDRMLGTERYNRIMDQMIEESGMDTQSLVQTLWMDAPCLRRLQGEGNVIGLHSHSHPTRISALPEAEQMREYRDNNAALEKVLGAAPTTVAHPCGDYGPETLDLLRDMGVKIGFRAEMDRVLKSPLEYPRENHAIILNRMNG